jgi:RNA polymerase sigma-70 factor (ECF subfamily)
MASVDPRLLEAAQAGDPGALESLLAVAQPDIRRYARRTCRASDVEDAVQETLVQVHRRVSTLRLLTSLSGWLFAIVRRECLRLAVKLTGRDFELKPSTAERLATRSEGELRLDVAHAIQSLPPHYREVVLLRDIEECSMDEICERLGLSRESAKGRLHRARNLLREYLDQ